MTRIIMAVLLASGLSYGEIHNNPGTTRELPHDKYVRVVSERDSPVEKIYIKTRDGLYVAAAMRRPKGPGPFPVLIHFHGAPGGRGMEQLAGWVAGTTGGPVWERFLQEGFVVVVADYRGGPFPRGQAIKPEDISYADDGMAVLEYVRSLPYVDKSRINLYGVSLGGDVVMHMLSRTRVHGAILGAPAPINFLGASIPPASSGSSPEDRWKSMTINAELARRNIASIETPLLIFAGTADGLIHLDRILHDSLDKAGKKVRMEIYENGYHDFVMGPQGQPGRSEPLLDSTLAALEIAVQFAKGQTR
jgi:dipeptidyl aminopeptidase/acylaminoacyl peptidase